MLIPKLYCMEVNRNDILKLEVTYFKNKFSDATQNITIDLVLNYITNDIFKDKVLQIRHLNSINKKDQADIIKNTLPAVTFSGTFKQKRLAESFDNYNFLLVLDIDKLNNDEMDIVSEILQNDEYVFAFWKSPSGNGYKGLIPFHINSIDINKIEKYNTCFYHREVFIKIANYFNLKYQIKLDNSGKDISRLCFFSWCPELFLKDKCNIFIIDILEINQKQKNRTMISAPKSIIQKGNQEINWNYIRGKQSYEGHSHYRYELMKLLKYLQKHNLSITKTYDDWTKVAFSIASLVHPDVGKDIFLRFCRLDKENHNEIKSVKLIYDAYVNNSNQCGFGTILFLAEKEGYIYTTKTVNYNNK